MAIITAIFGALFGLYLNTLFTWKIKNRIDALDIIYIDILEYNAAFLKFCAEQSDKTSQYIVDNFADIKRYHEQSDKNVSDDPNTHITAPLLDEGLIKDLAETINPYINRAYLNCYIIDEIKVGTLYQKVYKYTSYIQNNISKYHAFSHPKSVIANEYQELLNDITGTIFNYRKEITSFPYILKRIFMNKYMLVAALSIIIILLSSYYFSHAQSIHNLCTITLVKHYIIN